MTTSRELSNHEVYPAFLELVKRLNQKDRSALSRRMFGVFLWCFLVPLLVSAIILILVKQRMIPPIYRNLVDWVLLFFPVLYSLYYLGTQVFSGLRTVLKHGGFAANLQQAKTDSQWRHSVYDTLRKDLPLSKSQWTFVVANFETDLARMQARTRYLTALAGAVFFMIMQGIDLLTSDTETVKTYLDTMNPLASEWVGLALFLLLLYLSGQQAHQHLARYLPCVTWVRDEILP